MSKLDWLNQEIEALKEQGLYNHIRTIGSAQGAWLTVDGRNVLNFCSNNYLGLANHPKIVEAAKEATNKYGVGPAAVRSICDSSRPISPQWRRSTSSLWRSNSTDPMAFNMSA